MTNWEWPLVFFTVLSQMAVGYLALVVPATAGGKGNHARIYLLPAGLLAAAMVISLAHLGHPENAYRALTHLGSSWLSREVLLFGLTFLLLVFTILVARAANQFLVRVTAVLALGSGLLGILASAMIYVLPARPAWNNFNTVLTFYLTAFLLGPALGLFMQRFSPGPAAGVEGSATGRALALLLVLSIISSLSYLSLLAGAGPEARLTVHALVASPWWWLRVVAGWLAPLGLSYQLYRKGHGSLALTLALLILLLAGELMGRALFYGTAVPLIEGLL
ncbi:anaerobic dimethyl sulfoxide reductase chain C [Moorella thermoacetica]|uniref:Anaerobic dimethyl sulfoxide reductase chain C n=1 Tax=Neomoorella thermoacetica TaxID=1525 RepID=A0A1J5P754_NEOTH|nr:anaerobic dimethyl sulfoxide reductase chain C [Moorella thermoacetica]